MSPSGRLLACQHTEMGFQQPKHPMILGPRPTSDTSPADMAKPCHFQMNLPLEVSRFQVRQPRESQLEPLLILPSNFCCYHPCISWGWLQVKYRARQTSCSSSCHVQIWVQHYSFTFFFSMAHYGIHHEEKVLLVDSTGSHRFKRWKPLELRCTLLGMMENMHDWCGRCWDIRISYNPDTGNKESLKKCFKLKEKTANTLPFFVRCCLVTCLCVKFYPIFTSSRFIRVCPTGYPKTI